LNQKTKMDEELPPPNWSPTGNSGCWRWDENGERVSERTNETRPCWHWYDDEIQEETKKQERTRKRKNILTKIKNFITIWK